MKRIKIMIKNNIILIVITLLSFNISLLIYKNNPLRVADLKILDDQFVINFILIVLGFTVTLITIMYSTFDKVRQQLVEIFKNIIDESDLEDMQLTMFKIFKNLKEDTLLILFYLVVEVFMSIYVIIDIPFIKWQLNSISKLDMILLTKLTIILLTLYALSDIIVSIFKLIQISLSIDIKKTH